MRVSSKKTVRVTGKPSFIAINPDSELPVLALEDIDVRCGAGLSAGFYTIEPGLAAWLISERNKLNRPIRASKARQLKHDISIGKFNFNGESIIFSSEGMLLDGQHRLSACCESGIPIKSLIAFGFSPESVKTVDQGASRRPGDVLTYAGYSSAFTVAAAARFVIAYEASEGLNINQANNVSRADIVDFTKANDAFIDSVGYGVSKQHVTKGLVTGSALGAVHWILSSRYGRQRVEEYLDRVVYGDNIRIGTPAYSARTRLSRLKPRSGTSMIEVLLRGWVAFLKGEPLAQIPTTGQFPKMIDEARRIAFLSSEKAQNQQAAKKAKEEAA